MICIRCGCSDEAACMTPAGPCHWVSTDPPICSACVDNDADALESPLPGRDCPVSTTGFHQPLYRADSSAYCVHCKGELDVPEVA